MTKPRAATVIFLAALVTAAPSPAADRVLVRLTEAAPAARIASPALEEALRSLAGRRGFFPLDARGTVPHPSPGEAIRCSVGWGAFKREVRSSRGLLAPPGTTLSFTLDLPPGARLETGALAWSPHGAPPVRFEVLARSTGRPVRTVWSSVVTPRRHLVEESGRGLPWRRGKEAEPPARVSLDLAPWAGSGVELTLRTRSEGGGDAAAAAFWLDPQVIAPGGPPGPRTILLLVVDSVRADEFDRLSRPGTPLDRLAAGGTRFANAWANGSWTRPSTLSLLTSRDARAPGLPLGEYAIPEAARDLSRAVAVPTLAETLGGAGYATAAFGDNLFASPASELGSDLGFDEVRFAAGDGATAAAVDGALEWAAARPGRPLFLTVHLPGAHHPRRPPLSAWLRLAARSPGSLLSLSSVPASLIHAGEEAGRLLEGLGRMGRNDRLAVLLSDHGRPDRRVATGEAKGVLDAGVLRVPLLVAGPSVRPEVSSSRTVQLLDVMPTVLDLAGVTSPPGLAGLSLRPLLEGTGDLPEREVVAVGASRERPQAVIRGGRIEVPVAPPPLEGRAGPRTPPDREAWLVEVPPTSAGVRGAVRVPGGRVRWAWPDGFVAGDRLEPRGGGVVFSLGPAPVARRVLLLPAPADAPLRVSLRSGGKPLDPRLITLGGAALRPPGNPFRVGGVSAAAARSPWYPAAPRDGAAVSVHLVEWQRFTASTARDTPVGGALRGILAAWGYWHPR